MYNTIHFALGLRFLFTSALILCCRVQHSHLSHDEPYAAAGCASLQKCNNISKSLCKMKKLSITILPVLKYKV